MNECTCYVYVHRRPGSGEEDIGVTAGCRAEVSDTRMGCAEVPWL